MGWNPIKDARDYGKSAWDHGSDFVEDVLETVGVKQKTSDDKDQIALAKDIAKQNATLITWAAIVEIGSLARQHEYESEQAVLEFESYVGGLVTDIQSAGARRDAAVTMEDTALETDIASYALDYKTTDIQIATRQKTDAWATEATFKKATSAATAAFNVATGRAELDLNNSILSAELIAKEALQQSTLSRDQLRDRAVLSARLSRQEAGFEEEQAIRTAVGAKRATTRDANTMHEVRTIAATIAAKYRTDGELAKSIYAAKHSIASTVARLGASGFGGLSGSLVAQDTQKFYQGQITALHSNINAELSLALFSADASRSNTLATASERVLLEIDRAHGTHKLTTDRVSSTKALTLSRADQDYTIARSMAMDRKALSQTLAGDTYENVVGSAETSREGAISSAIVSADMSALTSDAVTTANRDIANRTLAVNTSNIIKTHEGRVGSLDLDYEILRAGKQTDFTEYVGKYALATEYQDDVREVNTNWVSWSSQIEADIALNQGEVTASSILAQSKSSGFQRLATTASIVISLTSEE